MNPFWQHSSPYIYNKGCRLVHNTLSRGPLTSNTASSSSTHLNLWEIAAEICLDLLSYIVNLIKCNQHKAIKENWWKTSSFFSAFRFASSLCKIITCTYRPVFMNVKLNVYQSFVQIPLLDLDKQWVWNLVHTYLYYIPLSNDVSLSKNSANIHSN